MAKDGKNQQKEANKAARLDKELATAEFLVTQWRADGADAAIYLAPPKQAPQVVRVPKYRTNDEALNDLPKTRDICVNGTWVSCHLYGIYSATSFRVTQGVEAAAAPDGGS